MSHTRNLLRPWQIFVALLLMSLCLSSSYVLVSASEPKLRDMMIPISTAAKERIIENKAILAIQSDVVAPKSGTGDQSHFAPPLIHLSSPLASHQIFGFAPYWTLGQSAQFQLQDYSTISYFSLSVGANGSIVTTDSGYSGFNSPQLTALIARAHSYSDRVMLTVSCLNQTTLEALTSSASAPNLLSSQVIPLLKEKGFDGINIDFEGQGDGIRNGLTRLITTVSTLVHSANPNWQVTVDSYASSAGDPFGPFDIASLNPAVDGFFVMGYDMENPDVPSPNAPLSNWSPSDVEALAEYTNVISPSKIILGIPFYGYDWTTLDGSRNTISMGSPTALSYQDIVSGGHPQYWDPTTSTPWTSYQVGNQWHETYYDDPASVALKVALANYFHVAGVGVWALGMDGNSQAMLDALLGGSVPEKNYSAPPLPDPTTTTLPQSATTTTTTVCTTTPSISTSVASTTSTTNSTTPKATTTTTTTEPTTTEVTTTTKVSTTVVSTTTTSLVPPPCSTTTSSSSP
ncbi:MAG: hypothetical protein HKL80_07315 [Acidimicrobiales bacterium]|nr:hypothetical protein [Acidimicrobiales bacterium]